jgi:hypothetical protein
VEASVRVFESSDFFLFDYFRVPYSRERGDHREDGWGRLVWRGVEGERCLYWPLGDAGTEGSFALGSIPLHGRVATTVPPRSEDSGWVVVEPITDAQGAVVAAIRRNRFGDVLLPFDPGEIALNCWSERYRMIGAGASRTRLKRRIKEIYYRIKPLLPRALQLWLRRGFTRFQKQTAFPAWPVEPALHDLYDHLFVLLAELAGEPIPRIAAWPHDRTWALVLTHDVETETGYRHAGLLRDIEIGHGLRSSWNLVARRYEVQDSFVQELLDGGFEVGVHGLHHDGRDIASDALLRDRLPEMQRWRDRWGASGFRSPATNRTWELMPQLGFDYDSSYPDTDPYEPDAGGCCSWLPFFNGDQVELPITLAQDHTLLEVLRRPAPVEWTVKAGYLRARGGMALLITHPDYMLDPERLRAYDRFLECFASDATAWHALPRDVSDWWRRRANSHVERAGDGWRIAGPAAHDGRVELVGADGPDRPDLTEDPVPLATTPT